MLMNEYSEYGSKEYYEREFIKQKLIVNMMSAGIADVFANRDRYTPYELGDMVKLYFNEVEMLESAQKKYDELFENEDEEE